MRSLQFFFGVFEVEFVGSKISKTAEVFAVCNMSESAKPATTEMEGASASVPEAGFVATPSEAVIPENPGVSAEQEQQLPVIPLKDVTVPERVTVDLRTSPAPSLTPMTPEDKDKPLSGKGSNDTDDDVVVARRSQRPRLHKELALLGNNLGKAVESMNEVSQAMVAMIKILQPDLLAVSDAG